MLSLLNIHVKSSFKELMLVKGYCFLCSKLQSNNLLSCSKLFRHKISIINKVINLYSVVKAKRDPLPYRFSFKYFELIYKCSFKHHSNSGYY